MRHRYQPHWAILKCFLNACNFFKLFILSINFQFQLYFHSGLSGSWSQSWNYRIVKFFQCESFCSVLLRLIFQTHKGLKKGTVNIYTLFTFIWPSCADAQRRHAPLALGLKPFRHKVLKTCVKDLLNDVLLSAGADGHIARWVCVAPCPWMCYMHQLACRNLLCLKTGHLHCASVWDSTGWLDWISLQMDRQSPVSHISSSLINNSRAQQQRQPGGTEPLRAADLSATPFISVTGHHHQSENGVYIHLINTGGSRGHFFYCFHLKVDSVLISIFDYMQIELHIPMQQNWN